MKRVLGLVGTAVLLLVTGCAQPMAESASTQKMESATAPAAPMAAKTPAAQAAKTPMAAAPAAAATAGEIIVDDKDPGFKSDGTWNSAEGDYYKGEVAWAEKGDTATATATWTAVLPSAGTYEVYEYHGENPSDDHATDAPYTIKYDGGSATVPVDQTKNIDKWNLLGTYKFAAGDATVTLTNKASANVIADAVKFVKVK